MTTLAWLSAERATCLATMLPALYFGVRAVRASRRAWPGKARDAGVPPKCCSMSTQVGFLRRAPRS